MFTIEIDTGNAAFTDPYTGEYDKDYEGHEICRILQSVIEKIKEGRTEGKLSDLNGNCVGRWSR